MTDNTIDGEVSKLFIVAKDVVRIVRGKITVSPEEYAEITNLIAQEANKAIIVELEAIRRGTYEIYDKNWEEEVCHMIDRRVEELEEQQVRSQA